MKRLVTAALILIIAVFAYKAAAAVILETFGISFATGTTINSTSGTCADEAVYLFLSVIFTVIGGGFLGFIRRK